MTHGPCSNMNDIQYKRQEETIRQILLAKFLHAMKEDLAEWISSLAYDLTITPDGFMSSLQNGVILCQHARHIQRYAEEYVVVNKDKNVKIPSKEVYYTEKNAYARSFTARDNVANFITWCRELGIPQVVMFETEDLVSHKNEKSVILTLLDVARKAYEFGVEPPELVRLEHEIDEEIERDKEDERMGKPVPKPFDLEAHNNLDTMVRNIVDACSCFDRFPIKKLAEGKYQLGKNNTLIHVRIMRKNVMVRVGGGWDTLDHYITKHDPCRTKVAGSLDKENKLQTKSVQKKIDDSPRRRNPSFSERDNVKSNRLSAMSSDAWSVSSGSTGSSVSLEGVQKMNCECDVGSRKSSSVSTGGKSSVLSNNSSLYMDEDLTTDYSTDVSISFTKSIEELDNKLQLLQNKPNIDLSIKDASIYENKADRWLRQQMNVIKQRRASDVENLNPMDGFVLRRGYTADVIERRKDTTNKKNGSLTPTMERKVSRTSSQPRLRAKTQPHNNSFDSGFNQSYQSTSYKKRLQMEAGAVKRRSSSSLSTLSTASEPSKQSSDMSTQTDFGSPSVIPRALLNRKRVDSANNQSKIPRPTFQRSRTMEGLSTSRLRKRNLENEKTPKLNREKSDLLVRPSVRREKSDMMGKTSTYRQRLNQGPSKRR